MENTQAAQTAEPQALTPEPVDWKAVARSHPVFHGQYPENAAQARATELLLQELSEPADPLFIAQRVTALLHHYHLSAMPPEVSEAVARDWLRELEPFPAWAIDAACAHWISRKNDKRRAKKPIPGDIGELAFENCAPLRAARTMIERYARYGDNPPVFLVS